MNVLVIGLGSMGIRRIRLLQRFGQVSKIIGADRRKDRREGTEKRFKCRTYSDIEEVFRQEREIQCVFVCTSPLSHSYLISEALKKKLHVFTELNLVSDGYKENMVLAEQMKRILFLSSTQLYREEIRFIKKRISGEKKLNYIYHIGQYLPDWHPWEKFDDFFIGDKRTNGCREIMAIEFPWLISVFGEIKDFHVTSGNMSKLIIPYKDNYIIQLEHESDNKGVLIIDVVSPKAVRNLEIYGENIYYCWDGSPASFKCFDRFDRKMKSVHLYDDAEQLDNYSSFVVENAYQREIQEFFDILEGKSQPVYGFKEDLEVLKLIDQIEGEDCG